MRVQVPPPPLKKFPTVLHKKRDKAEDRTEKVFFPMFVFVLSYQNFLVLKTAMTDHSLPSSQGIDYFHANAKRLDVQTLQERIYSYLIEIVKNEEPEDVLRIFTHLFIDCVDSGSGIEKIFQEGNEQDFHKTIKRCCYILINNWETDRNYKSIKELVDLLAQPTKIESNKSKTNTYKTWIANFVNSSDYQELKLFAYRHELQQEHWVNRYTSYLLVAQSLDKNNSNEQKEAAKKLSKQLKDKFKFELAMYIARSESVNTNVNRYKNPSILGDDVLRLIKTIVVKRGVFSYENIAHIFLQQTQNQNLQKFKISIQKYLIYSEKEQEFVQTLKQELSLKLSDWQTERHQEIINKDLLLRICNKIIDYLTTENGKEPSRLFILLLAQGHSLTLVIVLLKIILICRNARSHLEFRMANLIHYYAPYPEDECQWIINFLEFFKIAFAIYAENVEYNLIKMKETEKTSEQQLNLDGYRLFSQLKQIDANT